ncbi:MAG: M81 family metallopeptidase [Anaerolineae bacterium]|nr:M81 family metallopeptidase [Anaerolineae bacterium]
MKIAIAGIATECCTFSPWTNKYEDFRIVTGDDPNFFDMYPFMPKYEGIEWTATLVARATPGGPVDPEAYDDLKADMLERLKADGPYDGVYLDMHGAMNVLGRDDAEGDWYLAVREVVGEDCVLAASYDLHGNVSDRIMETLDVITGYRTAPHIDYMETRERACDLLMRCLKEGIRPVKAFIKIPVGLPGEKTSTEWFPGDEIYAQIPELIDGEKVMDVTMQVGYIWADEPRMTACAIGLGQDEAATKAAAETLALSYWNHRADFKFGVPAMPIADCIQSAMQDDVQPVFISDSGDNPTAGGVGDVTVFLAEALRIQPPDLIYASIPDAAAVAKCVEAGIGGTVTVEVGGKMDPWHGQPLEVTGTVTTIVEKPDNTLVVLKSGGVQAILTVKRTPFHYRQQFLDLGIVPEDHKIVVVKIGYLVPELKAMAQKAYLALSPGAVNQDIINLTYNRIQRPCYPFDADMIWSPTVQVF